LRANEPILEVVSHILYIPKFSEPNFLAMSRPFFTCAAAYANTWASGLVKAPFMYLQDRAVRPTLLTF